MGFKRTPEGRVFFQGTDTANDESPKLGKRPSNPAPQMRSPLTGDKTQIQIVTLLKTLNERLKVTQADRDRMMGELEKHRQIIEDLEDKASRSERLALDLEHKLEEQTKKANDANNQTALKELEETRKAIAEMERNQNIRNKAIADKITKSGAGIKALHKRIESTEAKQGVIDERVEAALSEQAKIIRKVDKAIEDRARFMRKIERIEETVIQTRDAINAKAMVVLTEQGVNSSTQTIKEGIAKYLPDDLESQIDEAAQKAKRVADIQTPAKNTNKTAYAKKSVQDKNLWQNPSFYGALTGGLAFILAVVVISGLALNDWKLPYQTKADNAQDDIAVESYYQTPQIPRESEAQSTPVKVQPIEDLTWSVDEQPENETVPNETQTTVSIQSENDDIGAVDINDAQQLEKLIETAPQKVAEVLNEIEPQKQTPTETVQASAPPAEEVTQAPVPTNPVQETNTTQNPQQPNEAQANIIAEQAKRDPNLPSAIKKVEDQAFNGVGEAQHDLAAIYTAGHGGVKQDYDRASYWFEKAAENGIPNASYNLGVLHHQGLGFKPDVEEAMKWYTAAAEQGHPEAQYNLGIAYIEGIGVSYNPNTAARYFENAARNGVVEAAYNLGLIYENGLLGAAEPDSALQWYKAAADQGSPEAKQALIDLANNLGIDPTDVNRVADDVTQKNADIYASNQGLVAQIQEYLMRAGLYPGPADGVTGALTSDAIRSYQSRNNLDANGEVSEDLLRHMMSNNN